MSKIITSHIANSIFTFLVFSFVFTGQVQAAELKVGYMDMQKAIQETSAGRKAKKDLEESFNKKKKEIEKKEADLKKMTEDFEKKNLVLSEEVKNQKSQEIQTEMAKYRELVGKSQLDIQKRERELTAPIVDKLRTILEDIAKNENYTMILDRQNVLWANKQIDLTDRVVKEFEKGDKKK